MNEEHGYRDGSDAAVRAAARRARRDTWIAHCRALIGEARDRVPPEPSPEDGTEQPNQHPPPQATDDDGGQ